MRPSKLISGLAISFGSILPLAVAADAPKGDPPAESGDGGNSFRIRPAEHAVVALAMAEQTAESSVGGPVAESQPAETQPAPSAWPPGLIMDGLNAVGLEKINVLNLRLYGFVESGFTGVIHAPPTWSQEGLPLRVFDLRRPNNLKLNALRFTLDRVVDTTKAVDWGGRFDFTYGTDSRLTHSLGLLDKQGHETQPDIVQGYGELWIKTRKDGEGLSLAFGKWVTPIGYELIDGPLNWLYSHSYLFGYAIPFTHTGAKVTYYFDPTNYVYFAAVRGWDTFKDNNDGASWMGGFLISGKETVGAGPRDQFALNFIGGPELAGDGWPGNRYLFDAIWTHRWTEKLTQVLNADWGYQDDAPTTINSEGVTEPGDANWWGLAYYLNYVFNDYISATGRAEYFRDAQGYRTGYRGDFFEITTGVSVTPFPKDKILKNLMIRPEIRWDWSANQAPFNGHGVQMTWGFDVIYKF